MVFGSEDLFVWSGASQDRVLADVSGSKSQLFKQNHFFCVILVKITVNPNNAGSLVSSGALELGFSFSRKHPDRV